MAEQEKVEAPKVEKPAKDSKNGVTRPKAGTKTGRVWEIADAKSAEAGEPALRAPVIEQCEAEGINSATAATQYGRWRKYHGLVGTGKEPKVEAPKEEAEAPVVEDDAV
ncbi:hypothetical protein NVP2117O_60 [Vibrio phage 2.117.O._10N.261.45.E9]|nr:hypothetical protein NVP1117O_60 [Vibrio phage 1.117.O._10N.261.45.E9]AUR95461.1 hypothetical protein NVP1207B_54 [Vibrio phage 1.207.B._10N.222.51.C2]AUS02352.1 hypothetical protein NVP2117O_60 [Vibrio phage 2.117.O._10N.261.45.E9]